MGPQSWLGSLSTATWHTRKIKVYEIIHIWLSLEKVHKLVFPYYFRNIHIRNFALWKCFALILVSLYIVNIFLFPHALLLRIFAWKQDLCLSAPASYSLQHIVVEMIIIFYIEGSDGFRWEICGRNRWTLKKLSSCFHANILISLVTRIEKKRSIWHSIGRRVSNMEISYVSMWH